MNDDDLERQLQRYGVRSTSPDSWPAIEARVRRCAVRQRVGQWSALVLLVVIVVLRLATARLDRAAAANAPQEPLDVSLVAAGSASGETLP